MCAGHVWQLLFIILWFINLFETKYGYTSATLVLGYRLWTDAPRWHDVLSGTIKRHIFLHGSSLNWTVVLWRNNCTSHDFRIFGLLSSHLPPPILSSISFSQNLFDIHLLILPCPFPFSINFISVWCICRCSKCFFYWGSLCDIGIWQFVEV